MPQVPKENRTLFLLIVGLAGWLVPGGGYFLVDEKKRAVIILVTTLLLFCAGIYVGSIGVIDPIGSWPWYIAQVMASPLVFVMGHYTAGGGFPVYGRPNEIGQIYTSIAGLLNLLCIINAVYLAHTRHEIMTGSKNAA